MQTYAKQDYVLSQKVPDVSLLYNQERARMRAETENERAKRNKCACRKRGQKL